MPVASVVRDPEVQASVAADARCHNRGTLEMFASMLDRSAGLATGKLKLGSGVGALWLAHGTADQATSYEASRKWFEEQTKQVPDREFKTYEGWSHQLHADLPENRPVFAKDVGDWILKRSDVTEGAVEEQSKL